MFSLFSVSAPKIQNASSRFFIERIGLKENTANSPHVNHKHKLRSRIKSHFHDSRGEKRQFGAQHLLPRPFDGSSVKGIDDYVLLATVSLMHVHA